MTSWEISVGRSHRNFKREGKGVSGKWQDKFPSLLKFRWLRIGPFKLADVIVEYNTLKYLIFLKSNLHKIQKRD